MGDGNAKQGITNMKLFLTFFASIIAASLAISLIALLVLFGTSEIFGVIAVVIGIAAFPVAIDLALKRHGA